MFYLDVSDELQSRGFYGGLAVYDPLYGSCPPHGLVQHLGVEAVRMLPPVHDDVPVTCKNRTQSASLIHSYINVKTRIIYLHVASSLLCLIPD